jgi:hypothetical protein
VQLHNATNVVAYLKHHMDHQHLTYDGARRGIHCCFYEVKIGDVNKVDQFNAWTVEGTRGFHQVKSVGLDKISFRVQNLSCFCKFCSNGGDGPCDNEAYIAPFTFIHLEPCNPSDAQTDVESIPKLKMDQEALVATLEIGDHLAVVAEEGNNEGSNFWILICE